MEKRNNKTENMNEEYIGWDKQRFNTFIHCEKILKICEFLSQTISQKLYMENHWFEYIVGTRPFWRFFFSED